MKITHESFVSLYNHDNKVFNKLFDKHLSINTLCNRIDKLSERFYNQYGYVDKTTSDGIETGEKKMKGDLFEIFSECFFKILGSANNIGVYGYKPVISIEDFGVDAVGLGLDNQPLTIQIKFRSNATDELIQKDLKQFAFQSIVAYNVNKDTNINMVLFTSAKGMHFKTENDVFLNRIRTIGIDSIERHVNKNFCFWKNVADMIENTVKANYTQEIINNFTPIIFE